MKMQNKMTVKIMILYQIQIISISISTIITPIQMMTVNYSQIITIVKIMTVLLQTMTVPRILYAMIPLIICY